MVNRDKAIARLVSRNSLYSACFFWVEALRSQGLSITVDQCIENFMKKNDLTEEDMNFDSARTTYYRMLNESNELKKAK